MLISGPYLRLHSEFEAEKSCIRREIEMHADIAQDGPETALLCRRFQQMLLF
jgi:hypothetical protein